MKALFFVIKDELNSNVRKESKALDDLLEDKDIKVKEIRYGFDVYSWSKRGKVIPMHGVMILYEDK